MANSLVNIISQERVFPPKEFFKLHFLAFIAHTVSDAVTIQNVSTGKTLFHEIANILVDVFTWS